MAEIFIKRNDTKPALVVTLAQDNAAVDLSNAVVMFHMGSIVDATATVMDGTAGTARYDWAAGDTLSAGCFPAEFEVTFADGSIQTFPNDENLTIIITKDVA